MPYDPQNPDWIKRLTQAERALAKIDEPLRRIRETGVERYVRQLEDPAQRVVDQLEGVRRFQANTAPGLHDRIERVRRQAAGPAEQVGRYLERMRESLEGPARQIERTYEGLNRLLEPYDVGEILRRAGEISERFERALRDSLPSNWRDLSFDDAERAHDLVVNHGVPIVWVPSSELTEQVVRAPDRKTALSILHAHRDEVLDDLDRALAEVTDPALQRLRDMATKAVRASRKGEEEAAQALASAVFTAALSDGLGLDRNAKVHKQAAQNPPDAASLATYRTTLVLDLASRFVLGWGKQLPGYNRNESLHTVSVDQYTVEHSLASLMAVGMLLREAQAVFEAYQARSAATP